MVKGLSGASCRVQVYNSLGETVNSRFSSTLGSAITIGGTSVFQLLPDSILQGLPDGAQN